MAQIERVAVIGAGVMGAGIAAHITNAGVPAVLLDIVPKGAKNRSALAEGAVAKLLKASPAAFMARRNVKLITAGNMEDDLGLLAECDWIIEAVSERPEIKKAVYERIETVRKPGTIVSSNTSTIPLSVLTKGMAKGLVCDFLITHFFNPPRYMRLLELVPGAKTRPGATEKLRRFADIRLGKGVVTAKDTPGFIANRVGIYWLQCGVVEALDLGLTVEEADAAMGRPLGIPKTGIFGLLDMVGLDLMPQVLASMAAALPAGDPFHAVHREHPLIARMVAEGYTGRKGKGGFYRLRPGGPGESPRKVKEAIDLETGAYRTATKPKLESVAAAREGGPRALLEHDDRGGRYAWRVLSRTLSYAARLVPEIADDIASVDAAMRLGYNWTRGPFELMDALGTEWFAAKLEAEGAPVPALLEAAREGGFYRTEKGRLRQIAVGGGYVDVPRAPGVLLLADVKRRGARVAGNGSASLWDIGDGVLCLEFHTKMNALDGGVLEIVAKALEIVPGTYKALVIHNDGANFSVGANLGVVLFAANIAAWSEIEDMARRGQELYKALKYAPFPVVGAPAGMALGGGCEILLHCDAIQAHGETYMGLIETSVGFVPSWGGCTEMLLRWRAYDQCPGGPMPPVLKVFETVSMATVSGSAAEAMAHLFLRPGDAITMNRDRVLADAKARALELAKDYVPPEPAQIALPGETGYAAMALVVDGFRKAGKATAHDAVVAGRLAEVLSGGDTDLTETLSEDALLGLERRAFMKLVREPATLARVEHMLETGKPLRN